MALSRESRALRESYEVFTSGVDPGSVIKKLYSKLLLTPEEKKSATQRTLTADQQLDLIFECLERRVSADPSVFNQLVHVMLEEPALAAVGKKMQGERRGCCGCMSLFPHGLCEVRLGCFCAYAYFALKSSVWCTSWRALQLLPCSLL